MLTQEQENTITELMKTSADDVIEGKQSKTNIEVTKELLNRLLSDTSVKTETKVSIYSSLAILDQLVLLNRSLSLLTQVLMQQRQSGIVVPNMKI